MTHVAAGELVPEQAHRPRHRKPDELAIPPVGDEAGRSYEDLYVEHAPAARAVALSMVPRDVADDIVAEAFTRVLKAIRAGGGPGLAFRAYLLTAVRNTANDWLRASRRVTAVGDVENDLEDRVPEENLGLARLSRGPEAEAEARVEAQLVARAFGKLPARWQAVLWQLEVEARAPAAIAPGFGLSANGVSALAVRAREGLRQAYLAEHVGANIPGACRAYAEALSADTRGRLSRRRQAAVHDHLTQCQSCHSLAGELIELNSRLGAILTPALLVMAMGATGHELMGLTPATGAKVAAGTKAAAGGKAAAKTKAAATGKAAAGAKAGMGAKAGAGAKTVLSVQWRMWRLHPLTATVTATAGLAAAGGMVFAVGVSPMSPFHESTQPQPVTERPAASAQVTEPALGGSRPGAGQPAGTASSAGDVILPTGTDGAAGQATGGTGYGTGSDGGTGASGSTGFSSSGAHPVQSLVGGVGSTVQGVTSGLGNTVQGVTSGLGNTVQGVTGGVGSTVQGVTSGLGNTVQGVTGGVGSTVQGVTGGVGSTVQGVTSGVGGVVQGVASGTGATVTGVGQTVNGVTQGLGSTVDQATTGLGNIISGTTAALSGGNPAVTAVGDAAGSLVQGVGGAVSGATGAAGNAVGGATSGVGSVTSGVGAAANGVVSGVGSAANGAVSGTGAAANGAVSGTGAAANGVVSGVGSTANGVVSGVGAGVSGLLGGGKS
ncbi:MAG TPA: sigma-70 family RNA polymerase sigma factor [Streptosporangiaceae bacterium]|nr:sigma-70 family RNA polymerase sigma factor [Streptosporangiaceae bacterium]